MILKRHHIFFLFLLISFTGLAQEETTLVNVSDAVPAFTYEKSPGNHQSFENLKGKNVLIVFFATWCGPCREELPVIQSEIYDKYSQNPKFEIMIFGREHDWKEVNKFKSDNKFTMPFYPDKNRKIYARFATQFIPRSFLISPEGKILFSSIGFDKNEFKKLKDLIERQVKQ